MEKDHQLHLSDDVRKLNRYRIISKFRQFGKKSRTEIGKLTELSAGTVTNVTTKLLDDKVIEIVKPENDENHSRHGRPRVQLELNSHFHNVAACSLTYNRIRINIINYSGQLVSNLEKSINTHDVSGEDLSRIIIDLLSQMPGGNQIFILVIGVQGLTANNGSQILWSPILSDGGHEFPQILKGKMKARLYIANDCAMIAKSLDVKQQKSEKSFGAVLMSYGVGMGLYIDGKPFKGTNSSALEIGHIPYRRRDKALCRCGKLGCVEAYASDYAIWRNANGYDVGILPDKDVTQEDIDQIIERAYQGEEAARDAIEKAGRAIGFGLATMFSLFDPFPVKLIGRGSKGLALMESEMRSTLSENFRYGMQLDMDFSVESDALAHIENGCAIIALEILDKYAAFGDEDLI